MTLVDGIDLNSINKEYNPAEFLINFDDFKAFDNKPTNFITNVPQILETLFTTLVVFAYQASDVLDKIYTLYVRNKLNRIIKRHKCITLIMTKLEKMHVDF